MSSLRKTQTDTQDNVRSRREASKRSKFPIPPLTKKMKNEKKHNFMSSLKKQGDPQNNVRSRREASKSSKIPIPPLTKKTKQKHEHT